MSLVTKKEIQDYDDSYLFKTLHSYKDENQNYRFVLTHYSSKKTNTENAEEALSKLRSAQKQEAKTATTSAPTPTTSTTQATSFIPEQAQSVEVEPNPTDNGWNTEDWGPNTGTRTESVTAPTAEEHEKLPSRSHFEQFPPTKPDTTSQSITTAQEEITTHEPQDDNEPETEIARERPKKSDSTPNAINQSTESTNVPETQAENTTTQNNELDSAQNTINNLKQAAEQNEETAISADANELHQNNDAAITEASQPAKTYRKQVIKQEKQEQELDASSEQKSLNSAKDFSKLQATFETTEWLTKANQFKVELKANIDNIRVKRINLTDLNDGSKNYLDINKPFLNMINSIIISKQLDLILIFRDGTTLNIAPATWLHATSAETLIKGNYNYVYHDLDIQQLVADFKPLCVAQINQPQYMQLWLKYIPILPAEN